MIDLANEITKDLKKEYSKLMRYLIKKAIDKQVEECLESYRSKPDRSYKQLFWEVVLPQMKNKLNSF